MRWFTRGHADGGRRQGVVVCEREREQKEMQCTNECSRQGLGSVSARYQCSVCRRLSWYKTSSFR